MLGPGRHVTVRLRTTLQSSIYSFQTISYVHGGGGHFSIRGVTFLYWKSDPGLNFLYGKVTHGSHFHRVTFPYDTGGVFTIAILKNHDQPCYKSV